MRLLPCDEARARDGDRLCAPSRPYGRYSGRAETSARRVTRILVVGTLVGAIWVGLSAATVSAAEATPQQYAKALQYAITKDLLQPGYAIRKVVVRPYHALELAKGARIAQFQVWVAYAYRGQSHVMYLVIFPDGEVLDQTMVTGIGDTGGLLG